MNTINAKTLAKRSLIFVILLCSALQILHTEPICCICLGEMDPDVELVGKRPHTTPCGHTYHYACLKSWLEVRAICPEIDCVKPVSMESVDDALSKEPVRYPRCSICLTKIDPKIKRGENRAHVTECNHAFHIGCIGNWLSQREVCPLCQTKVLQTSVPPIIPGIINSTTRTLRSGRLKYPDAKLVYTDANLELFRRRILDQIRCDPDRGIDISMLRRKDLVIPSDFFNGMEDNIVSIGILGCKLKTFPIAICNLHNLGCLCLSYNKILTIPAEIVLLQKLHRLDINHNFLIGIPEELGYMPELKTISLRANPKLKKLPESLIPQISLQRKQGYIYCIGCDHLFPSVSV
jgi:hypothetical protein